MQKSWEQNVIESYEKFFLTISKLLPIAVGLGSVAYFLGWVKLKSYYSTFDASWLLSEIPPLQVLSNSIWPVVALLAGAILALNDLIDLAHTKSMKLIHNVIYLVYFFFLINTMYFGYKEDYFSAIFSCNLMMLANAIIFGLLIGDIAISTKVTGIKGNDYYYLMMFIFSFIFVVYQTGSLEGKRDKKLSTSKLPTITTVSQEKSHLVLFKGDQIIAAVLSESLSPKIIFLEQKNIKHITHGKSDNLKKAAP